MLQWSFDNDKNDTVLILRSDAYTPKMLQFPFSMHYVYFNTIFHALARPDRTNGAEEMD